MGELPPHHKVGEIPLSSRDEYPGELPDHQVVNRVATHISDSRGVGTARDQGGDDPPSEGIYDNP